jgi:hypothetical protein
MQKAIGAASVEAERLELRADGAKTKTGGHGELQPASNRR